MENGHRNSWYTHKKWWFSIVMQQITRRYQSLPEGKSFQIPLNHHFPMVFLWFSYGGWSQHRKRIWMDHCPVTRSHLQDLHVIPLRCEVQRRALLLHREQTGGAMEQGERWMVDHVYVYWLRFMYLWTIYIYIYMYMYMYIYIAMYLCIFMYDNLT